MCQNANITCRGNILYCTPVPELVRVGFNDIVSPLQRVPNLSLQPAHMTYCWWKKSCTSWHGNYPTIYKVVYMPGGAGFLPSTVCVYIIYHISYHIISYLNRLHVQFVGLLNHNSLMIHLLLFTFPSSLAQGPKKTQPPGPSPSIRSCRSPTWIIPISQFVDQNCLVFEDQEVGRSHPVSLGIGMGCESLSARKISTAPRRWWKEVGLPTLVFVCFFARWLGRRIYSNIGEDYEKWSGVFLMGWKPRAFCW